jgi:hypothetical protein
MNNYTRPKGPTCSEPVADYGAARTPLSWRARRACVPRQLTEM